jgi:hypothetical protein
MLVQPDQNVARQLPAEFPIEAISLMQGLVSLMNRSKG